MAKLTQGTQIYFIDPDDDSVVEITGVTSLSPGGSPADQIETTTLSASDKTFMKGLRSPGQASLGINADPTNDSHVRLHEISLDDDIEYLEFAIGWSDGTAVAAVDSAGDYDLPTSRTWLTFNAYVADFPFDFTGNSVVKTTAQLQRTGTSAFIPATT